MTCERASRFRAWMRCSSQDKRSAFRVPAWTQVFACVALATLYAPRAAAQERAVPSVARRDWAYTSMEPVYRPTDLAIGWRDRGRVLLFVHLAFHSNGADVWDFDCDESGIYARNVQSGALTRLADTPFDRRMRYDRCGPYDTQLGTTLEAGARSLLYASSPIRSDSGIGIYRYDISTGERSVVSRGCGRGARNPSPSPDGHLIAALAGACGARPAAPFVLMGVDGSDLRALPIIDTAGIETIAWSPDERQFVYGRWRRDASGGVFELVLVDTSGANQRVLGQGTSPAWNPDGKWIAYTRRDGLGAESSPSIDVVAPDGSMKRTLVVGPKGSTGPGGPLLWSRDGRWVVFSCNVVSYANNPDAGGTTLWRVTIDGGRIEPLTGLDGRAGVGCT